MFQLPLNEFMIKCEMAERQRENLLEPESVESYRWFHRTKSLRPNWFAGVKWHLGHRLVAIGQQLERSASEFPPALPKHVECA